MEILEVLVIPQLIHSERIACRSVRRRALDRLEIVDSALFGRFAVLLVQRP